MQLNFHVILWGWFARSHLLNILHYMLTFIYTVNYSWCLQAYKVKNKCLWCQVFAIFFWWWCFVFFVPLCSSMDNMGKICDGHSCAPPKPWIFKMILDFPSSALFVEVISNVIMIIAITCIAMGMCATTLNGPFQLLLPLVWVMLPLLGLLLSVKYVFHTYVYYSVPCSNNIHSLHIRWNVQSLHSSWCAWSLVTNGTCRE